MCAIRILHIHLNISIQVRVFVPRWVSDGKTSDCWWVQYVKCRTFPAVPTNFRSICETRDLPSRPNRLWYRFVSDDSCSGCSCSLRPSDRSTRTPVHDQVFPSEKSTTIFTRRPDRDQCDRRVVTALRRSEPSRRSTGWSLGERRRRRIRFLSRTIRCRTPARQCTVSGCLKCKNNVSNCGPISIAVFVWN